MRSRLDRLEARTADRWAHFHVICNISDDDSFGGFLSKHGRMKTDVEMDAEEAALFASGKALPGDEVHRIILQIVDAQGRVVEA